MTRLSDKLDPVDLVALCIVLGCFTSMTIRGDTVFKDIVQTVMGFYFGYKVQKKKNEPPL